MAPPRPTPKEDTPARSVTVENYLAGLTKKHGPGSAFALGSQVVEKVEVIPSDIPALDAALGVGGLPRGRIVEIYGPESSGKTTISLQFLASAQRHGGVAHFIDAEHALDITYAGQLGVDVPNLILSQPQNGEQALEIACDAAESKLVDFIVIDSVAALVPKAELEGDMGDPQMGLQARLMSQAMRKLTGIAATNNVTIVFINQLRMKIGVMFGNPETTTGGNALKFYASIRLDVRRIGAIKHGDEVIGNKTKIKVVKNKVAPPFREVELDLLYGHGFDSIGSVLDMAVEQNIIEKSGAWYAFNGERVGQGRENAREFLKEHPEVLAAVREKMHAA